jgi:CO/xanthine dehydrogenase Mo-binding subunit
MSKEFKIIGKRQPKIDGSDRVSGRAKYASDLYLPGMLYAKILRSPYPHAKVLNIDIEKAKALPGVKAVLTHKDVPSYRWESDMPILTDMPASRETISQWWRLWMKRKPQRPWI